MSDKSKGYRCNYLTTALFILVYMSQQYTILPPPLLQLVMVIFMEFHSMKKCS